MYSMYVIYMHVSKADRLFMKSLGPLVHHSFCMYEQYLNLMIRTSCCAAPSIQECLIQDYCG